MIENVTKSTKRKQTVDDAYMEKLFADVTSLYRLDQKAASSGKADLGPLPATSVILLVALALTWVGILSYLLLEMWKKKKQNGNKD